MPEDIIYPIKARDEASPVFARFLETLAETDKGTERLRQKVDELTRRNAELTASIAKLEEEHGRYSAILETGTQNVQAWIEAQTKVDALNERLSAADRELAKNKQELTQAQQKLTEAVAASGGTFEKLGHAVKNFAEAPLQSAHQGINALLAALGPMAIGLGTVAAGAAAAGLAVYKLGQSAQESALHIQNMAAQTGLTVTEVQALDRAAEELGVGDLTRTLANLQMQLGREEGSKFTNILRMMGIAIRNEQGNYRSMVDLLGEFSDKLKALQDPARASQLALEAMGIRGRALLPILLNQSVSFRDYIAQLERWAPLSKEAADRLVEQRLEIERSLRPWESFKHKIGESASELVSFARSAAGAVAMIAALGPIGYGAVKAGLAAAPKAGGEGGPVGPPLPPDYYERRAADQERFERRVAAIAQNLKGQELELTVRLQEEEEKLRKVRLEGTEQETLAQARAVAAVRERLAALKEAEQEAKRQAAEQKRAFEELDKEARAYAKSAEKYAESLALVIGDDMRELWGRLGIEIRKAEAGLKEFGTVARGLPQDARAIESIPKALEPSKHSLDELGIGLSKAGERARDMGRQVSTIFTDLSRDIAENVLQWKGWAESIGRIVKDFAKSMLRILIEELLEPLERRLLRSVGSIFGGGVGAGGVASGFAGGGFGSVLSGLFGGKGAMGINASQVPDIGSIVSGTAGAKGSGFLQGTAGQALVAGGMIAGNMLLADAWRRGSKGEGLAGGALTGASIGTMIAPGIGTAIGAGIGAAAGFFAGLFGGGEKRRAEERARRAAIQSQYLFTAPEAISRSAAFGIGGEADIESDLTGRVRAIAPAPAVKVEIQAIDLEDFERKKGYFSKLVAKAILAGHGQLADNVAWAAQ